ncbi:hypothetical protein DPV73_06050 [Leptospira mayottensis]|nr:hypothetical protein DPV73_06050 [Leptospira mayottensis]
MIKIDFLQFEKLLPLCLFHIKFPLKKFISQGSQSLKSNTVRNFIEIILRFHFKKLLYNIKMKF